MAYWLHMRNEAELAALQTRQKGNSCTLHVIAAAIRLLLGYEIDPESLAEEINKRWWRAQFMRVLPGWAVTPRMQVEIVKYLSKTRKLLVDASLRWGSSQMLLNLLADPDQPVIPIITLVWLWGQAPPIYFASTTLNFNKTKAPGGHSMILAAYDPEHWAEDQFPTPWGFINPWMADSTHLFWMRDVDFLRAWGFSLPGMISNPLVTISPQY